MITLMLNLALRQAFVTDVRVNDRELPFGLFMDIGMKAVLNTFLTVLFLCSSHITLADLPPPPPALTDKQKITRSDYVIVGKAERLVYVERDPNDRSMELTFEFDSPSPPYRGAFIEVRIVETLCEKKEAPPKRIRINLPADFRTAEQRKLLYLDKELIYFLTRNKRKNSKHAEFTYRFIRGERRSGDPISLDHLSELRPYLTKYCS